MAAPVPGKMHLYIEEIANGFIVTIGNAAPIYCVNGDAIEKLISSSVGSFARTCKFHEQIRRGSK